MLGTLGIAAAPSAQAAGPDAATTAVGALFTRLATDFLPQVASGTAVSRQLPTLAVTPAESVGLKTAFSSALGATGPLEDFGTQDTLADLKDYVDDADGSGWAFTSSNPTDTSLTVGFTRTLPRTPASTSATRTARLSLSSGTGIVVTGTLTGSFTFVFDATSGKASLTSPSLSIATSADLPATTTINAGLGILGVSVTGTADTDDYRLQSNVSTSWANPDNDAAGLLAFDNPDTAAADDGELAAEGAGTGIVTATQVGSLAGSLEAKPRASDRVAGLPSVGTTVTLSSAAPASFEAPLVTAVVPEAAKPFLTMTPRDLAAALSQAASAVLGMQNAGDGDLPLMRGSLSNAIDAVGGIKNFLADQVPDADPDDQTPGQPKFASLQDMLAALDAAEYADSGWSIDVLDGAEAATYDPGTKKVNFTVVTTRGGKTDLELNPLGAATSGTGTAYTATGLTASGVDLDGPKNDGAALLAGRKVTAGTSTAHDRHDRQRHEAHPHGRRLDRWHAHERHALRHRGCRPQDRRPAVRRRAQDEDRSRRRQRRGLDREDHPRRRRHPADGPRPQGSRHVHERGQRGRPRLRPRNRHRPVPLQADRRLRPRPHHHLPPAPGRPRHAPPEHPRPPRRRRGHHLAGADQHHERLPRPRHHR